MKKSVHEIPDSAAYRRVAVGSDIEVPVEAGHMGFEMAYRASVKVDKEYVVVRTASVMWHMGSGRVDMGSEARNMGMG